MEFIYGGFSKSGGTYKITNKLNGRIYVGSAKCFQARWSQHVKALEKGNHSNRFLLTDYKKCGQEVFLFEVFQVVEGSKEDRLAAEQALLDVHFDNGASCYNFRKYATSREGNGAINPEETFRRNSEAAKKKWQDPEYRKKIPLGLNKGKSMPFKGISRSEETKRKIQQTKLGHVTTEETKQKIALRARENMRTEEKRKECAERQRIRWQDPEYRAKMLATNSFVTKTVPAVLKNDSC